MRSSIPRDRRSPFLLRRGARCLRAEMIDPAADGGRHAVAELGGSARGFRSQTREQARAGAVVAVFDGEVAVGEFRGRAA